jgi:hypothetical protein
MPTLFSHLVAGGLTTTILPSFGGVGGGSDFRFKVAQYPYSHPPPPQKRAQVKVTQSTKG